MSEQHSFGYWLRLQRKAFDLTREGLADRVGCSAATIRKIESEERRPSAQIVEHLADIFEIPLGERHDFMQFARGVRKFDPRQVRVEAPWQTDYLRSRLYIPQTTTSLIARAQDIKQVHQYLLNPEIRLVTLIGPPGVGKTRLCLAVAHEAIRDFPDGVFFVPLAPIESPAQVAVAILQSLSLVEGQVVSLITRRLVEGIGTRRLLLVIDNCEHLIEGVAPVITELLAECPNLKILATSREAMRVSGEWLFLVPALAVPKNPLELDLQSVTEYPALRLFEERGRSVRSDFKLDANNLTTVASICSHLDGLPLAIELLAARVRILSPQAILERLNEYMLLSADGMRAIPVRQKTLHNTISWSYNLLSPEEQTLFAYLSVFSGGFSLVACESIFQPHLVGKPVADIVLSLLDKSLLLRSVDANGEPRFFMLFTIKQFAQSCLRLAGNEDEIRNAHLAYFQNLSEEGDGEMRGSKQVLWIDILEMEYDNFQTALEWCLSTQNAESGLRLLAALGWAWEVRGHYCEMRNWFEKIHNLMGLTDCRGVYAQLLNHVGRQSWTQGNYHDARIFLTESCQLSQNAGAGQQHVLAETLNWSGLVAHFGDGDSDAAISLFEKGLHLFQEVGDARGIALSTFHLGIVESDLNHDQKALSLLEQSLALFRQFGDLFYIARTSVFLGYLALKQGDFLQARQYFEQHLKIDQDLRYWDGIANGLIDIGNIYRYEGDYEQAGQNYNDGLVVCRQHGLNLQTPLYLTGLVALYLGDYSMASQRLLDLFLVMDTWEDNPDVGVVLTGLAAVAGSTNQPERAAKLFGAARAILDRCTTPKPSTRQPGDFHHIHQIQLHRAKFVEAWTASDQAEFKRLIDLARGKLGQTAFKKLESEGRAMSLDQVIDYTMARNISNTEKLGSNGA